MLGFAKAMNASLVARAIAPPIVISAEPVQQLQQLIRLVEQLAQLLLRRKNLAAMRHTHKLSYVTA